MKNCTLCGQPLPTTDPQKHKPPKVRPSDFVRLRYPEGALAWLVEEDEGASLGGSVGDPGPSFVRAMTGWVAMSPSDPDRPSSSDQVGFWAGEYAASILALQKGAERHEDAWIWPSIEGMEKELADAANTLITNYLTHGAH